MKIWKVLENFYGEHINKLKLNTYLYINKQNEKSYY